MTTEQKAYDVKVLVAKFKAKGLDLAEETAKMVVGETLEWAQESAVLSKNPYDDVLAIAIPAVKPTIMKALDKIDGQVG